MKDSTYWVIEKQIRDDVANLFCIALVCDTPHARTLRMVMVDKGEIAPLPINIIDQKGCEGWVKTGSNNTIGKHCTILKNAMIECSTGKGGDGWMHTILRVEHNRRDV